MNIDIYLRIVKARWPIIVGVFASVMALMSLYLTFAPREFSSSVTLYISSQGSAENLQQAYQGGLLSEQRVTSYAQLASNRRVWDSVAQQLADGSDPESLSSEASATAEPGSVLITLTVIDQSPERAAQIVNLAAIQLTGLIAELEQPLNRSAPPTVVARVVEPGIVDTDPVSPRVGLSLGLAFVFGIALGLSLAAFRHLTDKTIRTVEELREFKDVPNLGVVPYREGVAEAPLVVENEPASPSAEAYRRLRTNLQFFSATDRGSAFVITSSLAGEGKSVTTANLGLTLVRSGARVLVIEADLRRPRVATYLETDTPVGLSSVLAGMVNARECMQTLKSGLVLLPSGPVPPNPSELLGSQRMSELLQDLERKFDIILIDSPPLLPVTDAAVLSTIADGAILVCRVGLVSRRQLETAFDSLRAVQAPILGTIATESKAQRGSGYSSYGYYESDPPPKGALVTPANATRRESSALRSRSTAGLSADTERIRGEEARPTPRRRT